MVVYSLMHAKITTIIHIQHFLLQIDGEFSYMIDIGVPGLDSLQIQIRKVPERGTFSHCRCSRTAKLRFAILILDDLVWKYSSSRF